MGYTESHKGRGRDYQQTFAQEVNPYRAMYWRLEQRALEGILSRYFPTGNITYLDFACGTGRILSQLYPHVVSATGVDVSASMMEVAREVAPGAELLECNLTQQDVLGTRQFNLITAFRFFPNAEPELRLAVLQVLTRHLDNPGILVFNNHKNRNSLPRRISRFLGREAPGLTMSHGDVEALVAAAGLRIVQVIPLASLPFSENHPVLPVSLLEPLERTISGFGPLVGIAQDVVYVCARAADDGAVSS
jgi:ubiquinone/menaquinone biosynthesis C-methylase UbiE